MGLTKYKAKRKFDKTPEPKGKLESSRKALRFVMQKHDASHLHYDFRLEMHGTLKSWAVPKGPSLNPEDKRLAMMVEDHPLSYRTFEGVIPEGNYGAGNVILWDMGAYAPEGNFTRKEQEKVLLAGLKKGHIDFCLEGKKLKGLFSLIKIRSGKSNKGNEWLLIKKRDQHASSKDVTVMTESVLSGKPLPRDILAGFGGKKFKNLGKDKMPKDIRPMLATLVKRPFERKGWIFELKFDGYRAITEIDGRRLSFYSRKGIDFRERYSEIIKSLKKIKHRAVLDGEVVALDQTGKPNFQLLQNYLQFGTSASIVYMIFDLIYLEGLDLRNRPLIERKTLLKQILPEDTRIKYSDHVAEKGLEFFDLAKKRGLEGIIAKEEQSAYVP